MVEAVDRLDLDTLYFAALQHIQRDAHPRITLRPDLAVEVGEVFRSIALHPDDHVSAPEAGFLGRPAGRYSGHEQAPVHLIGVEAEPRPAGAGRAPARDEIAQDG